MVKVTSSNLILNNTLTPPLTQQTKMGITGSIGIWVGSPAPPGALFCDGAAYTRSLYPQLANSLGVPDTSLNFQVPNLKQKLPRGTNSTIRLSAGTEKIQSIGHQHTANSARFPRIFGAREVEFGNGSWAEMFEDYTASVITNPNTTDTQINYLPKYLAVNFIIYT